MEDKLMAYLHSLEVLENVMNNVIEAVKKENGDYDE